MGNTLNKLKDKHPTATKTIGEPRQHDLQSAIYAYLPRFSQDLCNLIKDYSDHYYAWHIPNDPYATLVHPIDGLKMNYEHPNLDPKANLLTRKLVILGDQETGKSSIMIRFVNNEFDSTYTPTIGVDFRIKNVGVDHNRLVKAQIWDTSGNPRYTQISHAYFRGANGFVLCFNVYDRESLIGLQEVCRNIQRESATETPVMILGHHIQKTEKSERQVTVNDVITFVERWIYYPNWMYFEVDAKKDTEEDGHVRWPFLYFLNQLAVDHQQCIYENSK